MFKNIYFISFIYSAVLDLSCGRWHLRSLLQYAGSLVVACGVSFPDQGSNPGPLHWELRVLTTEPARKSPLDVNLKAIALIN